MSTDNFDNLRKIVREEIQRMNESRPKNPFAVVTWPPKPHVTVKSSHPTLKKAMADVKSRGNGFLVVRLRVDVPNGQTIDGHVANRLVQYHD